MQLLKSCSLLLLSLLDLPYPLGVINQLQFFEHLRIDVVRFFVEELCVLEEVLFTLTENQFLFFDLFLSLGHLLDAVGGHLLL